MELLLAIGLHQQDEVSPLTPCEKRPKAMLWQSSFKGSRCVKTERRPDHVMFSTFRRAKGDDFAGVEFEIGDVYECSFAFNGTSLEATRRVDRMEFHRGIGERQLRCQFEDLCETGVIAPVAELRRDPPSSLEIIRDVDGEIAQEGRIRGDIRDDDLVRVRGSSIA